MSRTPTVRHHHVRLLLMAPLLAVGLLVLPAGTAGAAVEPAATGAPHAMSVTALDFSYRLSTTHLSSGLDAIRLRNDGTEPHQAQLAQFKPGLGVADFRRVLAAGGHLDQVLALFAGFYGGPNTVLPGHAQITIQDLPPGNYLMLCFVGDPKTGMPHFAMGMYAPFDVVGPARSASHPEQETVLAVDPLRFAVPTPLLTDSIVRFENHSRMDVHEFAIGRLHPGKTVDDVVTWAKTETGPPPFDEMGGAGAVNPGGREWFTLTLPPGSYVAYCLVPDDETGLAHAAMGMVTAFDVAGS